MKLDLEKIADRLTWSPYNYHDMTAEIGSILRNSGGGLYLVGDLIEGGFNSGYDADCEETVEIAYLSELL